jgi:macrocin-O-methyltransferase TylF-like protien
MKSLLKSAREAVKSFAFRYTSLGAPTYRYNIEPIQLALLVNECERLKSSAGNIVEIGVARGLTTRFLCEHITSQGLEKTLTLYAIDTFDSFTRVDLEFEVKERGKSLAELEGFSYNDLEVWRKNFARYPFVKAVKADCSSVDYGAIAPIKIALLDVDLYLPTKKTLPKLYASMIEGGVILVDDILDKSVYDGAYQAYMEFCADLGITPHVVGNKCGVIYKGGMQRPGKS